MNTSDYNIVLSCILVMGGTAIGLLRLSPYMMKRLADWLNARADAEEWFALRHQLYKRQRAEREECGIKHTADAGTDVLGIER